MTYRPRIIDSMLADRLRVMGAVLIEGPKGCGKTATALQISQTIHRLDTDPDARAMLAVDPRLLLDGRPPILLDEWQVSPDLWNHVRRAVDERSPAKGQSVLTGSSVPADDVNRHSGAGRITTIEMRPMSLFESENSTGEISLAKLIDSDAQRASKTPHTIHDIIDPIVIGGWPDRQELTAADALVVSVDYLSQIRQVDISRVAEKRRDPARMARLLASLARNVATEAPNTKLANDASTGGDGPLDRDTTSDYLNALQRLKIVEDQPAWGPHLRSRTPLRMASKRHLVDPSLAAAALDAGPDRLLKDLNWTSFLFESLVVRDLRVYAQPMNGTVLHYRDKTGLEADAVVQLQDGRWGAFEVKMGASRIDDGAASLLRFAERIDTEKSGKPAVLGVITATGFGYRKPDGVQVIPIGALGP